MIHLAYDKSFYRQLANSWTNSWISRESFRRCHVAELYSAAARGGTQEGNQSLCQLVAYEISIILINRFSHMLRFSMRKGPRMFDVSGCPGGLRVAGDRVGLAIIAQARLWAA